MGTLDINLSLCLHAHFSIYTLKNSEKYFQNKKDIFRILYPLQKKTSFGLVFQLTCPSMQSFIKQYLVSYSKMAFYSLYSATALQTAVQVIADKQLRQVGT